MSGALPKIRELLLFEWIVFAGRAEVNSQRSLRILDRVPARA
jgi:hypothetical protein